jgi:hypothetical protein
VRLRVYSGMCGADASDRSLGILAAATTTSYWIDQTDGVITEAPQGIDDVRSAKGRHRSGCAFIVADHAEGMFVRGLYELWTRTSSSAAQALIAAFISVQVPGAVFLLCVAHARRLGKRDPDQGDQHDGCIFPGLDRPACSKL